MMKCSHEYFELMHEVGKKSEREFGFDDMSLFLEFAGLVDSLVFLRYGYMYMDNPDSHDFLSVLLRFEDEMQRFQNRLAAFLCQDDLIYTSPSDRPAIASNE